MARKLFAIFFMLLVALASHEVVQPTEARVCESQSHRFHGRCFSSHNCAEVCRNEGFSGGKCSGARGRCFCTKHC